MIKAEGFLSRRVHESPSLFFLQMLLSPPVVRKVSGIVTMKSVDMYILHDSSLVVSFSNISAYFVSSEVKLHVLADIFA